jgi:hypothetical protein
MPIIHSAKILLLFLTYLNAFFSVAVVGFQVQCQPTGPLRGTPTSLAMMVDGAFLNQLSSLGPVPIAAAAGLAGTAIGWTTRSAEVSTLQDRNKKTMEELNSTKETLELTKQDFDIKMKDYEKAIFEMDQEFEGQTSLIKAEYEEKLKQSKLVLEDEYKVKFTKAKAALQKESELKLLEQEGKLKQEFLQEKLSFEATFNTKNAEDIVRGLERQSQLITENNELKESLDQVQAELKEIMKMKKSFFN